MPVGFRLLAGLDRRRQDLVVLLHVEVCTLVPLHGYAVKPFGPTSAGDAGEYGTDGRTVVYGKWRSIHLTEAFRIFKVNKGG